MPKELHLHLDADTSSKALYNTLDRVLRETDAEKWARQARWLNDWREQHN